jgi:hypothetical protein
VMGAAAARAGVRLSSFGNSHGALKTGRVHVNLIAGESCARRKSNLRA